MTRAIAPAVADQVLETKNRNRVLSVLLLTDEVRKTGKLNAAVTLAPALPCSRKVCPR